MKQSLNLFFAVVVASMVAFGCKKPSDNPQPEPLEPFFEVCLFHPGDYQSSHWRIPALRCLSDGSLLAFSDKRKYNNTDLPEDIDIVVRRSTDCGKSWTEPMTMAEGTGYKHGFGDCAVVEAQNGDVVCAYVGGNGLWASTASDPQRSYIQISHDGGKSFEPRTDITSQLWGIRALNSACKTYTSSFFGSGNGLLLKRGAHKGRIMFVAAMVKNGTLDNFAVYSDDNGKSWNVSQKAYTGGDEAKVVELKDGSVLMSIRQSGARGYAVSHDGGETWEPQGRWPEMTTNACNGDMIRYSATDMGGKRDILLHSVPNSMERENVSIFVSYDEGTSWQLAKSICPGGSCYSSLTVLPDGRIGFYYEKGPTSAYELWYCCFTLEWLLGEE